MQGLQGSRRPELTFGPGGHMPRDRDSSMWRQVTPVEGTGRRRLRSEKGSKTHHSPVSQSHLGDPRTTDPRVSHTESTSPAHSAPEMREMLFRKTMSHAARTKAGPVLRSNV